ncbi:DNA gyrase inhibitor YacG [Bowmanella dokdonensis]|uniref:DNA gyrase inhibitor YacG n=1 Tax=Bowmanella dokdonensis TaxID=751969 RepID=A0A939DL05_9ALTE|nr:DNA gyrase inhibitor YacG [Bowmanella dokdonensis]MBN7824110.1 DNA gyrase inhibitor YacG [Bowmanella dokdonensis]
MKVNCPTCQTELEWGPQSPYRPFCSKRCQLIDLGEWANEEKAIPVIPSENSDATELPDIEEIEALLAQQGDMFFKQ